MENLKVELLSFRHDETKSCRVFVETKADGIGQWSYNDDHISVRVSFTANGEEWANSSWSNPRLTQESVDDENSNWGTWIGNNICFSQCITDKGRKHPPYQKEQRIKSVIAEEAKKADQEMLREKIKDFYYTARKMIFDGEGEEAKRIKQLEEKLAEAEARVESTSIESIIMRNVADALTPAIAQKIKEKVGALAGAVPVALEIKIAETVRQLPAEVRHSQFEKILAATIAGESLWLKGDAGTGKSFICKQVADALGAEYYCTGSIMDEYAGLKGFIDANGVKHGTEFTKALDSSEEGNEVVICFDEADGSIPEVMVTINNFLAGGIIECMGKSYTKLDNLHIVACGNTNGRGGSTMYTRQIIDEATLDRFAFIEVDYDKSIELNVAGGDEELADFCRQLRTSASNCGIQMLVTYRAIKRLHVLTEVWKNNRVEALRASVIRGLDRSDLETIIRDMDLRGYKSIWRESLEELKKEVA